MEPVERAEPGSRTETNEPGNQQRKKDQGTRWNQGLQEAGRDCWKTRNALWGGFRVGN